jgi:hypothetical protein
MERAVENDAKLEGLMSYEDLNLRGWEVHPYLQPVIVDGIAYCHFFTSGVMGRPVTNAKLLLQKNICHVLWDTYKTEISRSTETQQETE